MRTGSFLHTSLDTVDFTDANLFNTRWMYSEIISCRLTNANLRSANLSYARFAATNISDEQLQSVMTKRYARLANGTQYGADENLIDNGNAICNSSLEEHWTTQEGQVLIIDEGIGNCVFVGNGSSSSTLQAIRFRKYADLMFNGNAILIVTARCTGKARVSIKSSRSLDFNVSDDALFLSKLKLLDLYNIFHRFGEYNVTRKNTHTPTVALKFHAQFIAINP